MERTNKTSGDCAMTFVCEPEPGTSRVFLAGDFNDWDPTRTRMVKRNGSFRKKMKLAAGEHQYKFVVDGQWRTDPAAMTQVPNDMGSMNSVVSV